MSRTLFAHCAVCAFVSKVSCSAAGSKPNLQKKCSCGKLSHDAVAEENELCVLATNMLALSLHEKAHACLQDASEIKESVLDEPNH